MRRRVWTVNVTLTLYVSMFSAVSVKRNGVQLKVHVAGLGDDDACRLLSF